MADFYQTGVVSTFHRFGDVDLERMEGELVDFNRSSPIALVLPATYTELEAPAIEQIVKDIADVSYLNEIVVTMGRTTSEQFNEAKKFFSRFPQRTRVIWNTGPALGELYTLLEKNGLYIGGDGKGRSAWMA